MDRGAIDKLLQRYFDALHHSDANVMDTVLHPSAVYATADEMPPLIRSKSQYLPVLAARPSPASRGVMRDDHVDHVELAGQNTAFAKVRCTIGERDFVDYLTLIRVEGEWQIISKIFHFQER